MLGFRRILFRRVADSGTFPGFGGAPSTIEIGDAANPGVAPTAARSDHEHAVIAPGAPTLIVVGNPSAAGASTTPARADHAHGFAAAQLNAASSVLTWGNDSIAAAADTRFLTPGFTNQIAATTPLAQLEVRRAGVVRNLVVRHGSAVGNGANVVYTLIKNAAPTALTATLASGAVGVARDLINTVAVIAGDVLDLDATKPLSIGSGGVDAFVVVSFDVV